MFCIHCGADISEEDTVCPNCHAQLHSHQAAQFHQAEEHAPFSKRAFAFLIDLLFIMVLFSLVTSIMRVLGVYLLPVLVIVYFALGWSSEKQGTFGMTLQEIKVSDFETGERISFSKALLRSVCMLLSVAVLFLGCLFMFLEKNGRMLHDLLAGTMVTVRNK